MTDESQLMIPVIDISERNSQAAEQLLSAASKYGFVFVENNDAGIAPSDIARMFELSKTFFSAPVEEKEKVSISSNKAGKNHGWLSRGVEKLDPKTQKRPDVKEAFNMGYPNQQNEVSQSLPTSLEPHAQTIIAFQHACHALCQRLLRHFATALSLNNDWFTSRHDHSKGESGTVFRLLYYPRVSPDSYEDGVDIRAGAHSDYGSLTLLFQLPGQPGLEIKTPRGDWASVPVDPSETSATNGDVSGGKALPILVNIGDLLEDWTGGLLKSTVHRVIFPSGGEVGEDRYSIAFFCHPLNDALLEPVPSEIVQQHAAKTSNGAEKGNVGIMTARDHLMARLAETYKVDGS